MDKLPAIPFTLHSPHRRDEVNLGTVVNKATNEQFSVSQEDRKVEVNRTRASEKKAKISKQNQKVIDRYKKVLSSSMSKPSNLVSELIRDGCSIF